MTADRHVAWYGELMSLMSGFQHDAGLGDNKANARESELFDLISRTAPVTPAEAAATLRSWLAIIRSGEGSNWRDELDLLAMTNVADFLESLPPETSADATLTSARFKDLELRVRRAEVHIEGLFGQGRKAA